MTCIAILNKNVAILLNNANLKNLSTKLSTSKLQANCARSGAGYLCIGDNAALLFARSI
jgi:hypothetical protein